MRLSLPGPLSAHGNLALQCFRVHVEVSMSLTCIVHTTLLTTVVCGRWFEQMESVTYMKAVALLSPNIGRSWSDSIANCQLLRRWPPSSPPSINMTSLHARELLSPSHTKSISKIKHIHNDRRQPKALQPPRRRVGASLFLGKDRQLTIIPQLRALLARRWREEN